MLNTSWNITSMAYKEMGGWEQGVEGDGECVTASRKHRWLSCLLSSCKKQPQWTYVDHIHTYVPQAKRDVGSSVAPHVALLMSPLVPQAWLDKDL